MNRYGYALATHIPSMISFIVRINENHYRPYSYSSSIKDLLEYWNNSNKHWHYCVIENIKVKG